DLGGVALYKGLHGVAPEVKRWIQNHFTNSSNAFPSLRLVAAIGRAEPLGVNLHRQLHAEASPAPVPVIAQQQLPPQQPSPALRERQPQTHSARRDIDLFATTKWAKDGFPLAPRHARPPVFHFKDQTPPLPPDAQP